MGFLNRNATLLPPEGFEIKNVSFTESIGNFFKGEVDAVLSKNEVKDGYYSTLKGLRRLEPEDGINHDFSMISDRNSIIRYNISRIKYDIIFRGKPENDIDLELCRSYVQMGLLSTDEITTWVNVFFNIKAREAINKIQKDGISKNDINIRDMYYLSYGLKTNTFSMGEKMILEKILEKFRIELNYMAAMGTKFDFLNERIYYFSNIKTQK